MFPLAQMSECEMQYIWSQAIQTACNTNDRLKDNNNTDCGYCNRPGRLNDFLNKIRPETVVNPISLK